MRDLHLAVVGLDANCAAVGGGQRPGEAALPLDRLAGPDADAPAHEALEVLGLGQRAVGSGRGDLERPTLEQVAQVVGHALAERQIHAARVVDVQAKPLARRLVQRDQLDLGIQLAKPVFDLPSKLVQISFRNCVFVCFRPLPRRKKGGPGPTSKRVRVRKRWDEYSPGLVPRTSVIQALAPSPTPPGRRRIYRVYGDKSDNRDSASEAG